MMVEQCGDGRVVSKQVADQQVGVEDGPDHDAADLLLVQEPVAVFWLPGGLPPSSTPLCKVAHLGWAVSLSPHDGCRPTAENLR